jgi:hypothetical protein
MFAVRIPEVAPGSALALVGPNQNVLVQLRPILALAGISAEFVRDGSGVTLPAPDGSGVSRLEIRGMRIVRPPRVIPLSPAEISVHEGEVYLATGRVADLLGATVEVDWVRLTISLTRTPPFPAQKRASVAGRRVVELARAQQDIHTRSVRLPYTMRSGAGVLEWSFASSSAMDLRESSLGLRLGAAVLGGEAFAGGITAGGSALQDLTAGYRRVFPNARWVRQVNFGDFVSDGVQGRSVRGVRVTNMPFIRDPFFARVAIAPEIPQGWEYEVYQNGRLLGFSEASTRTPIQVPVQYGNTPVQVRMYGPGGEEVVSNYLYEIPPTQLPAGQFQYAVGGGACPSGCNTYAYGDFRQGVTRWLTVGGGADHLQDSTQRGTRPFGLISVAPGAQWIADAQGVKGSFYRFNLHYFGSGRTIARAAGGKAYPGEGQPSHLGGASPRWFFESTVSHRLTRLDATSSQRSLFPVRAVRIQGRVDGTEGSGADRWRVAAEAAAGRSTIQVTYEAGATEVDRLLGVRALAGGPTRGPLWLRHSTVFGGVTSGADALVSEFGITLQPRSEARISVAARWSTTSPSPSLTVGVNALLGFARMQSRAVRTAGVAHASLSLDGAIAYGSGVGAVPSPRGGIGSSGVSGRVFYDRDGNGQFTPGDEVLPNVQVLVGGLRTSTRSDGVFQTWLVLPYEVVPVRVDTLKIPDPGWVPASQEVLLRPAPHMFNRADIPLVRTRELSGRVLGSAGIATVAGVGLELKDLRTGVVQRVTTFSDGEFYVGRVAPGRYELSVAKSSLTALGARAEPAGHTVLIPAEGDEVLVELPPIQLRRST